MMAASSESSASPVHRGGSKLKPKYPPTPTAIAAGVHRIQRSRCCRRLRPGLINFMKFCDIKTGGMQGKTTTPLSVRGFAAFIQVLADFFPVRPVQRQAAFICRQEYLFIQKGLQGDRPPFGHCGSAGGKDLVGKFS